MIYYGCPKCQSPMASPESMAGQAETCPECGNVMTVPAPTAPVLIPASSEPISDYNPRPSGQIIVTERTSKKLKLHVVLSALASICGAVLLPLGANRGILPAVLIGIGLLIGGLLWFLVTRIRIWWRHG